MNLPAGGCEGSDDSQQGETPLTRGDADKPSVPSDALGGKGGIVGEEEQRQTKGAVLVLYMAKGKAPVRMELRGDPFDVCEQVSARMCPGAKVLRVDEKFDQIMRKRKEDGRRAK